MPAPTSIARPKPLLSRPPSIPPPPPAAATTEHSAAHLLGRRLVLDLLILRNLLLELLVRVVDEAVDRLEEAVDLDLLVLDVEGDLLEVEQPFPGVGVAGLGGRLKLLGERLDRVCDVLKLGLELLIVLIDR